MAALGEKLRREREARGVSLREISVATRIHENYLRALEENDYGALPGSVFVTGFLRNYATHLGLDADKIVAEFEAMKIEPPVERNLVPGLMDDEEERSFSTIWVVGSLFLILVIYIAYVSLPGSAPEKIKPAVDSVAEKAEKPATGQIYKTEPTNEKEAAVVDGKKAGQQLVTKPPVVKQPVTKPPVVKQPVTQSPVAKPPVPAVTKEKPAPKATLKKRAVPRQEVAATVKPKKKKKTVPRQGAAATIKPKKKKKTVPRQADVATPKIKSKYRLVVSARDEDAWILVVVDDRIERDMFVRAGQTIIIRGNKSFNFTTGNARQISLTLNGKPLNIEIPPDNVLRSWNIPLPEAE